MNRLESFLPVALLFFCLWTALLARLKGYSALCWLFAAGPIGVVLLCKLTRVNLGERQKKSWANRLGLSLSATSLLLGFLFRTWFERLAKDG